MSKSMSNGMKAQRPVRIANCSGATGDPGYHMLNQAKYGNVDVITGDYLAEINLAQNAEAMNNGTHTGYESTALDGLTLSLEILNQKRIKVVINGGALNPKGLAEKVHQMVVDKKLNLKVAYVSGDDLRDRARELLKSSNGHLPHFDSANRNVHLAKDTDNFLENPKKPIVSAHAYLGARAIRLGLDQGADIIICGRVSDASPVIGAAQWWHGWSDTAFDELAGSLIAGHLIECSTYSTGANFAGFDKYPTKDLLDLGLPIVEIDSKGECVVTKADDLNGMVTADIIKCQLLYELQGDIYLNSDVKADISNIVMTEQSKNRVHVSGVKGYPPPPTTKFAVFYRGGFQCEVTINATGYATPKKFDLQEMQLRTKLDEYGILDKFDILEFQRAGIPAPNPRSQLAATTYLRIFAQSEDSAVLGRMMRAWADNGMQHFSGMHCSMDFRTAVPRPYLAYFPALVAQSVLNECVHIIGTSVTDVQTLSSGHPPKYEPLAPRNNYEPTNPVDLRTFGPTTLAPLGDIALARSGDKGANLNFGIFVQTEDEWDWLRSFMTRVKMAELMGDDWRDEFWIERVEMPRIRAVHFVIYGVLGRGVSSSSRLDSLGKGFADFIRFVHVPIPTKFLR